MLQNDVLHNSVYQAVLCSMDELPSRTRDRAVEVLRRVEERMPKVFEFVSANEGLHLTPFKDLVSSLHRLPSHDGVIVSVKEIDRWLLEVTFEAKVVPPSAEYRMCVYALLRRVLCFTREDLIDADVGFYRSMMAFVRPLRDAITEFNRTH